MPIHDWTQVDAGIFHHFHHEWISSISNTLNQLLPADHYALAEQIAGGLGPDVLTLQRPDRADLREPQGGAVAIAERPPKVQFRQLAEIDAYAAKAKSVVIRHTTDHRVIAVVEIVSPGNKNSRRGFFNFTSKAIELLRGGVHLLILDLFPPSVRDPQGIHKVIWDAFQDNDFSLPPGSPLTLAAYRADQAPEAFVEPTAFGRELVEMPVFLASDIYVPLALETTYRAAWQAVPKYWRDQLQPNGDAAN
jgi:Protein of unknown function (DUF4058)